MIRTIRLTLATMMVVALLILPFGAGENPRVEAAGTATVFVSPASSTPYRGDLFMVEIRASTGSQVVDVVGVYLDFDPTFLQIVDEFGNPASQVIPGLGGQAGWFTFANAVDNSLGTIDYVVATLGAGTSGDFKVCGLRFKALDRAGTTTLAFHRSLPRETDLLYSGNDPPSVLGNALEGQVTVRAGVSNIELAVSSSSPTINQLLSCTATVLGGAGEPLGGVPIQFTVSGAHPQSATATTNPQGRAAWGYTASSPGADLIVASAEGIDSNAVAVTWVNPAASTFDLTHQAGWNLISLPLVTSPTPSEVFPGLGHGWHLYAWDAVQGKYLSSSQMEAVKTGEGYWLKTPQNGVLTITGTLNKQPLTIPLHPGWNMVGLPSMDPVTWSSPRVLYQEETFTLDQAAAAGLLSSHIYRWTGSSYEDVHFVSGWFHPGYGYWVRSWVECLLWMIP